MLDAFPGATPMKLFNAVFLLILRSSCLADPVGDRRLETFSALKQTR